MVSEDKTSSLISGPQAIRSFRTVVRDMVNSTWADMVRTMQASPAGGSGSGSGLIGSPEVREAAKKVAEAELEVNQHPSYLAPTHDVDEYRRKEQAFIDARVAYEEVMRAAAANAAAAAEAATTATPSPPQPVYDPNRNTHEVTRVAVARAMHDFRAEVPTLVARSLETALAAQAPPTVSANPASDSNIAGTKRPAKTASGDAKRAKVGGPLVSLRLAEQVCTNCRVPRAAHDSSTLGLKCTKPAVPATAAELAALEKGKAKA